MAHSRFRATVWTILLVMSLVLSLAATAVAAPSGPVAAQCFDESLPVTVEETRLEAIPEGGTEPASQQILARSGFDRFVDQFITSLCRAPNLQQAENMVRTQGTALWRAAVDRAQGRGPAHGDLDRYDDRPLYWARLSMTRALRQWAPAFPLSDEARAEWIKLLEYTSRGITSVDFPAGAGVKRVLVSGFDPYTLNQEPRRSNPSGASALQLDGLLIKTDSGPAFVQAVIFPVLWGAFEEGIVEDAFGPHLMEGPRQVDLMMTISQGGARQMAIEQWAGNWRGGSLDNNDVSSQGMIPLAANWPQTPEPTWFIETTLPYQAMIDAGTGPWPVFLNTRVRVWPDPSNPGVGSCITREDGPHPGDAACAGGGGNYLSNESMYRSNRLRLALGRHDLPGGHLHIASLVYPEDRAAITDPVFEEYRKAIVDQTVALVAAAARAVR